jgi:stage V sporulation protein R
MADLKALRRIQEEIESHARAYGLDFPAILYELVDFRQMNALAACEGFPVRYPHWRFGMAYERLSKSNEYGLHRIYEMVINNVPCYAYLLEGNSLTDHKLVMAHVCGHADFFKNNLWFSKTDRKMMDNMANHASRVRRYMDLYGTDTVEQFMDQCLSIEELIDFHEQFIRRSAAAAKPPAGRSRHVTVKRIISREPREYMDDYLNPPEYLAARRREAEDRNQRAESRFPASPARDVLQFLMEHSPLEDWQRDILSIVRSEAYYFVPQRQTKIMNEGWAAYWHSKIMTQKMLTAAEAVDYADHHSGTMAPHPGQVNPYRLGFRLFQHIEERWNRGHFGKEYDDCQDLQTKRLWNKNLELGVQKIFEVRRLYNDVTFLDEFLTPEFCEDHRMFTYEMHPQTGEFHIISRDFDSIKRKLLFMLTNGGNPVIELSNANHSNRGELYLVHRHEGVELHLPKAHKTLENLFHIWKRPVYLQTVSEGEAVCLRYDGKEHGRDKVTAAPGKNQGNSGAPR